MLSHEVLESHSQVTSEDLKKADRVITIFNIFKDEDIASKEELKNLSPESVEEKKKDVFFSMLSSVDHLLLEAVFIEDEPVDVAYLSEDLKKEAQDKVIYKTSYYLPLTHEVYQIGPSHLIRSIDELNTDPKFDPADPSFIGFDAIKNLDERPLTVGFTKLTLGGLDKDMSEDQMARFLYSIENKLMGNDKTVFSDESLIWMNMDEEYEKNYQRALLSHSAEKKRLLLLLRDSVVKNYGPKSIPDRIIIDTNSERELFFDNKASEILSAKKTTEKGLFRKDKQVRIDYLHASSVDPTEWNDSSDVALVMMNAIPDEVYREKFALHEPISFI